jgi:hypothetical protein
MSNFTVAKPGTNYKLQVKYIVTQPSKLCNIDDALNLAPKSLKHVCDHCHVWPETWKLCHLDDSMTTKNQEHERHWILTHPQTTLTYTLVIAHITHGNKNIHNLNRE